MLTTAGATLVAIICTAVFILFFRFVVTASGITEDDNINEKIAVYLFSALMSTIAMGCTYLVTVVLIYMPNQTTDNYRTIYSNQMNASVKFVTSDDEAEFIGGQPIKRTTKDDQGTLTLSKDGVDLKKDINVAEYLGDVETGSTVEKIEYSNSVRETNLFGVVWMKDVEYPKLKIHLKKTAEKISKDRKDAKIKKELKSLIESSN